MRMRNHDAARGKVFSCSIAYVMFPAHQFWACEFNYPQVEIVTGSEFNYPQEKKSWYQNEKHTDILYGCINYL